MVYLTQPEIYVKSLGRRVRRVLRLWWPEMKKSKMSKMSLRSRNSTFLAIKSTKYTYRVLNIQIHTSTIFYIVSSIFEQFWTKHFPLYILSKNPYNNDSFFTSNTFMQYYITKIWQMCVKNYTPNYNLHAFWSAKSNYFLTWRKNTHPAMQ